MKKHFALSLVLGVALSQTLSAQTYLTGISEFSTTAAGQASGGSVWNTKGGDSVVNIFVSSGTGLADPFINGPSDANTAVSIPLNLGTYNFTLFAGSGGVLPNHAINLFFNGNNSAPGISAVAATRTSIGTIPSFGANASVTTKALDGFANVPGAGALSYLDGTRLITLTSYYWAAPSVFNADRISAPFGDPGYVAPGGGADWVGQITLTVIQVPEPSVAGILLLGLLGLKRRSKN